MSKHRFGVHTSVAGGLTNGAREAVKLGATAFQIFTRSPRMWKASPLSAADVSELKQLCGEADLKPLVIHASYLINLAAGDPTNRAKSVAAFRDEVERGVAIGADYLVFHPGSSKDFKTAAEAIEALGEAFAESVEGVDFGGLRILFENTAGGGNSLGRTFEELAQIRASVARRTQAPTGYCVDTCHTFAAGYDITDPAILEETIATIDSLLGLDNVHVLHLNDSKAKCGSKLDRHERLGEGLIGWDAMQRVVRHPKLAGKALILETPHDPDGTHTEGVKALRKMLAG